MNAVKNDAKAIFLQALDCTGPDDLKRFLDEACGTNEPLRARVEELLQAHRDAGNFLSGANAHDLDTEPIAECPGTMIGPYKLIEQIGEGGFGIVFMAEQQVPVRRKVALKLIKPGMDTRHVIARFEAERQALALMDHPNIAKILDAGTIAGARSQESGDRSTKALLTPDSCLLTPADRPYFVMELVRGLPITDYCDQNQLTPRQRLELFVSVCQAVQHAHQKGIIHRDLKPTNVLVTLHDGTPVVKVIDFGIAKALGQQLTEKTLVTNFAQMIGTPLYMSPEQAELSGLDADTRSDIYSLGVLLYELLTGTTPFEKERLHQAGYDEMRRIIREEEPPKPSTRLSTLGATATSISERRRSDPRRLSQLFRGELDWIVMKALEKDRNRRYETAGAFAADVGRHLGDEPVEARPATTLYRAWKLLKQNRRTVIAVTAFMLALLTGTAVSIRSAVEADEARGDAEEQRQRATANYDKARELISRVLAQLADKNLGVIPETERLRRRILADAAAFYAELSALNPRDPRARAERAKVCCALGKFDEAIADYKKAIELQPDNVDFHMDLANATIHRPDVLRRDLAAALHHARLAVEIAPKNLRAQHMAALACNARGMRDEAREHLRIFAALGPKTAEDFQGFGIMLFRLGDLKDSLAALQKARDLDPANCWIHYALAETLDAMGEYDRGLAAIEQAIQMNPDPNGPVSFYFHDLRAGLHWKNGKPEHAIADWNRSIEMAPYRPYAYKRRGLAYFMQKNYSQALADIAKAVEVDPAQPSNLTWISPKLVAGCPDDAFRKGMLKLADTAAERSGSPSVLEARAQIYAAMGRPLP